MCDRFKNSFEISQCCPYKKFLFQPSAVDKFHLQICNDRGSAVISL